MKSATCLAASLLLATSLMASSPKGTVPRSSASRYPAHAESAAVAVGAVLLTTQEVQRAFASDLNRCCLVIEVALYPKGDKPLEVSWDDFTIRLAGTDRAAKPASAELLAAVLQKKAQSDRDVVVSPSVEVGYGSGDCYDPVTGRRTGGGVYTGAGVGVGVGGRGNGPGSTGRDRDVVQLELTEKGLPEGSVSKPVAGYLYFQLSSKKKAAHQLEYTLDDTKVTLRLP